MGFGINGNSAGTTKLKEKVALTCVPQLAQVSVKSEVGTFCPNISAAA
jgi:hypothetical protein